MTGSPVGAERRDTSVRQTFSTVLHLVLLNLIVMYLMVIAVFNWIYFLRVL